MFIKLVRDEEYRGRKYKAGEVIEVGGALGERLILNGHKKTTVDDSNTSVAVLSDEDVDALSYKEAKALVEQFDIETENNKHVTYSAALKSYFADKRGA